MGLPKAYLPAELWQALLAENGWRSEDFLRRYDLVLHLQSTANGAEEFYTKANNAARTETLEEARAHEKSVGRAMFE